MTTSSLSGALPLWLVGSSGLLAGEFLRLLEGHPALALAGIVSRKPGVLLRDLHPHLADGEKATIDIGQALVEIAETLSDGRAQAALVLALPHGKSAAMWRRLRSELGEASVRLIVVDLSADYRLQSAADYEAWYGKAHEDEEEVRNFRYGLPELDSEHANWGTRIAAPGCFATALQLACVPAARAGLLSDKTPWILDAVTGSSGSGIDPKPGTHHPHRASNMHAYALGGHRHEAELQQALEPSGMKPRVIFVPHSGPFVRGIHLTAYLPLVDPDLTATEVVHVYAEAFASEPFVEVLPEGAVPDLRRVVGSNRASMGVAVREGSLVCLVTLDNVIKGGSGQALQALNLALGIPAVTGLNRAGLGAL